MLLLRALCELCGEKLLDSESSNSDRVKLCATNASRRHTTCSSPVFSAALLLLLVQTPKAAVPFTTPLTTAEMAGKQAVVATSAGTFVIDLRPDLAPNHVGYFIKLASAGDLQRHDLPPRRASRHHSRRRSFVEGSSEDETIRHRRARCPQARSQQRRSTREAQCLPCSSRASRIAQGRSSLSA